MLAYDYVRQFRIVRLHRPVDRVAVRDACQVACPAVQAKDHANRQLQDSARVNGLVANIQRVRPRVMVCVSGLVAP